MSGDTLYEHSITLHGRCVVLRPMAETDWDVLSRWNNDPEVLWYSEGDDVTSRSLEDVQGIYREVSQTAFCFIIEVGGQSIGECWLQRMNLERILSRYAGRDSRRIDLAIGEKQMWSLGYGTDTISVLTRFGFEDEGADLIFACGVADYNPRSRRAFEKVSYVVDQCIDNDPGRKARCEYDLVFSRNAYFERRDTGRSPAAEATGGGVDDRDPLGPRP